MSAVMMTQLPPLVDIGMRLLSTGGIVTLVGLWWRRDIALRKIATSEAGDLRDDYATELAAVRAERHQDRVNFLNLEKHLRGLIRESDTRHTECEENRQRMRVEMDAMHDEINGLKAQIRAASTDRVLYMEQNPPEAPHSREAARRLRNTEEDQR